MTKRTDQSRRSRVDLFLSKGANLVSRGFPKAAVELVKDYRQRRRNAATFVPRKARLLWLLPLPLIPATVIALGSGRLTAFLANAALIDTIEESLRIADEGRRKRLEAQAQLETLEVELRRSLSSASARQTAPPKKESP